MLLFEGEVAEGGEDGGVGVGEFGGAGEDLIKALAVGAAFGGIIEGESPMEIGQAQPVMGIMGGGGGGLGEEAEGAGALSGVRINFVEQADGSKVERVESAGLLGKGGSEVWFLEVAQVNFGNEERGKKVGGAGLGGVFQHGQSFCALSPAQVFPGHLNGEKGKAGLSAQGFLVAAEGGIGPFIIFGEDALGKPGHGGGQLVGGRGKLGRPWGPEFLTGVQIGLRGHGSSQGNCQAEAKEGGAVKRAKPTVGSSNDPAKEGGSWCSSRHD